MPSLTIPPELKPITPFVRRAEELDKDASRPESRLVAYYCRQYAVHTGIPLASASGPAAKTALGTLLEQLETEKQAMDQFTAQEAEYLCRQFAYQVFDKADQEDRQGNAGKTTAKTFYTSASFLQMLEQFYPQQQQDENMDEEAAQHKAEDKKRALYAKWKATDILKAIKEGRTPQAGGYGEDDHSPTDEEDEGEEVATEKKEDAPDHTTTTPEEEVEAPADEKEQSTLPPPAVETVEDDEEEEEGQEIAYSPPPVLPPPPVIPPPVYPGPTTRPHVNRPPMGGFDDTPAVPPPVVSKPVPPPKKSTWFGNKKTANTSSSSSKAQLQDATELTKFALAALEDKNGDLAAERLQQALQALGKY
eukprot:CAMPEP_0172472726 /NCGR_PEP_ID=MMETSP1065-20121228/68489_1 /TAXON_ID=265537 /ORGANISM="Amphiprora paludosa, Strain CCMP125" /LENGTH=361 /DNA_ID=CAMNT_0013230883 /DNA_START=47 /DNA_END=1132 /DNA_ORIENTATION=+